MDIGDGQSPNLRRNSRGACSSSGSETQSKGASVERCHRVTRQTAQSSRKKSLWPLLTSKADGKKRRDRFVSLLSTMPGKHGSTVRETEVPRRTLVQALKKASRIVETTKFKAGELSHEHTVRLGR